MDKNLLINALIAKKINEYDGVINSKMSEIEKITETLVKSSFDELNAEESIDILVNELEKEFKVKLDISSKDLSNELSTLIKGEASNLRDELILDYKSRINSIKLPKNGKDGDDGKDGKDYILTEEDKQQIANAVIVEVPELKERTAVEILDLISGQIEISDIKGLDDKLKSTINRKISGGANKTWYLKNLPDVDVSGLDFVDGKYILGSGSGGGSWGEITGTLSDQTDLQIALDSKTDEAYVDTAIASLVDSSPEALNTLNELSEALGDDPNFATTVTNQIATKSNINHTHVISDVTGLQNELDSKVDDSQVLTDVPAGAIFTDTVYDDSSILADIATKANSSSVLTDVPVGALFTDTLYDDTTIQSEVDANTTKISATGSELEATDIDTISKLNSIVSDATLIDTSDGRLSDARTPLAHTHVIADITDAATVASSNDYADLDNKPSIPVNVSDLTNDAGYITSETDSQQLSIIGRDVSITNGNTINIPETDISNKADSSQVLTDVPVGALFTDTIYDDSTIQAEVDLNTAKVSDINHVQAELPNVDNTSDLDKPISTATQTALNAKADLNHTHTKSEITDFDESDYATAVQGGKADTALQSVVAGTNITVDNSDPLNPIVNSTGGGGGSSSAADTTYDNTDSSLIADDVKDALDELDSKLPDTTSSPIATEESAAAASAGSTLGLEQALLANAGQPGLTVLAVGYTTSGKVQGVSLGAGNVVEVYANGTDFSSGTVLYREFMNQGEPICFTGLSNGAIITSTQGFYGFSEQVDGADESPMPLLSYGLSFKSTFMYAFRNCQSYLPGATGANQGWIHVVNGPLANTIKLTDGSGVTVQGQENIDLEPWGYYRLYTSGNQEYIIGGTNPMMACHNANMDLSPHGRFYDSRLIMPLTNDGITWPRSGFVSAPYDDTIVDWYTRDNAEGSLNSGLGVSPGTPIDFDAAAPLGTGANDSDYEPNGATRVLAIGLISAYSGADSAGLEASPLMPTSAMSQIVAQPLTIADTGDGGDSGVAISSPYVGTAKVYEYNTTTNQLDLAYTVPLNRNGVTVTSKEDQKHPSAGLVANESSTGSVTLVGQLNPGLVIADVPITVVVQNGTPTLVPSIRSQNGTTTTGIVNQDDETLSLGVTPASLKAEITEGADGILYKRTITGGTESWVVA